MKIQLLIAAALGALTLGATVASTASAEPEFTYRTNPPPSNPHDVFRTMTKVYARPGGKAASVFPPPREPAKDAQLAVKAAGDCACGMMKGDAAMRAHCMEMKPHAQADTDRPG